jgi:hypothetical protein
MNESNTNFLYKKRIFNRENFSKTKNKPFVWSNFQKELTVWANPKPLP